jgi:hypothetical protein
MQQSPSEIKFSGLKKTMGTSTTPRGQSVSRRRLIQSVIAREALSGVVACLIAAKGPSCHYSADVLEVAPADLPVRWSHLAKRVLRTEKNISFKSSHRFIRWM